jgi:hypothetical protein
MAMTLVSTVTVGAGGAASLQFDNIPQSGKDLLVLVSARHDSTSSITEIRFNGSSADRSMRRLTGDGTNVFSGTDTNIWARGARSDATASTFSNSSFYVANYAVSQNKSVSVDGVNENNGTLANQEIQAGLWSQTAAITSVTLVPNSGNFVQYTSASLYIVEGPEIGGLSAPKATGGAVTYDGGYWYHTFTGSGTFSPSQSLSCDVLIVAGGGGGAGDARMGGGGAGGVVYASSQTISTNQTVTIGAGGVAGVNTGSGRIASTNGENSIFGSLTTAVGGGRGGYGAASGGVNGGNGGSGGGGGDTTGIGGTGTSGQGFAGGNTGSNIGGGGGGGAGAAGQIGQSNNVGGFGGNGTNAYAAFVNAAGVGESGYIAGGGAGGGSVFTSSPRDGGLGGGGDSGYNDNNGQSGFTNSGGGGGAAADSFPFASGGNGGSGVVIVRYLA